MQLTTEASAGLTGSSRHVTIPLSSLTCFPARPCPWHGTRTESKIQSSLELCSLRVLSWARPQLLCPLAEGEQESLRATKEAPLTLTLCLINRQVIVLSLLLSFSGASRALNLGGVKGAWWAEGEDERQCSHSQGLSLSHGKLWGFDGPSKLSRFEVQRLEPPLPALTSYWI